MRCTRRLGPAYAQRVWQMLADAARLGVIRHGRPEAWAAGAVIALARANGLLGAGPALTAQQVAEELDVSLGALAVSPTKSADLQVSLHNIYYRAQYGGWDR